MRILALSAAAAALALPVSAHAQDPGEYYVDDYPYDEYEYDYDASSGYEEPLSQRLSDPATQDRMATSIAVLGEILLDLPLAPIVDPIAQAAGRAPGSVDPDLTLRRMNPEAGDVAARAATGLPRAMDAMAAMAGSIESLRPALRDMADRLEYGIAESARDDY